MQRLVALTLVLVSVFYTMPAAAKQGMKNGKARDVKGRTLYVSYDQATKKMTCADVEATGSVCQLRGSDGDIISVQVTSALPGLFQYNISSVEGAAPELSREAVQQLGLIQSQTPPTTGTGTAPTPPPATPVATPSVSSSAAGTLLDRLKLPSTSQNVQSFKKMAGDKIDPSEVEEFARSINAPRSEAEIRDALRSVARETTSQPVSDAYNRLVSASDDARLSMYALENYKSAVTTFKERRRDFLALLGVTDDANDVAREAVKRMKDEGSTPPSESVVADEWRREAAALKNAPPEFTTYGPQLFAIGPKDLTITIAITPKDDYFGGPSQKAIVLAGISQPWRISTTTGFVVSSLLDDSYVVKQVTDPSTMATRNTAEREKEDKFRPPEAAFLLHITPGWGGYWDRFSGSFGIGITSGASGRMYLGLTYHLGAVAAITAGGVGGKVKRLGNDVDPNNLGNTVPNDKLRDVYRTGWMIGLSWRIAQ